MKGIKMGEKGKRSQRFYLDSDFPTSRPRQPPGLCESLFPQSILPTREDGKELDDSTGGEDRRSLLLTPHSLQLLLPLQVHCPRGCFC